MHMSSLDASTLEQLARGFDLPETPDEIKQVVLKLLSAEAKVVALQKLQRRRKIFALLSQRQ